MADQNPRLIEANDTVFQVKFQDGSVHTMPNITSYAESEGATPTTQKPTLGGTATIVGRPAPSAVTFNIEALPHIAVYQKISNAKRNSETVQFTYSTKQRTLFNSATSRAAIAATTGLVTFSGGDDPDLGTSLYSIGDTLLIANKHYIIADISDAGVATVETPPTPAVTASEYKWVIPSVGRPYFPARITSFADASITSDDSLTTTLNAQLTDVAPNFQMMS